MGLSSCSFYNCFALVQSRSIFESPPPPRVTDLWSEFWDQWLLLGDSVSIQRVPLHVGMVGNKQVDQQAVKGAWISLQQVTALKTITNL